MKYTIVIAAYNEAENIGPLTTRIIGTLERERDVAWDLIYVIAGTDGTRAIAQSFADNWPIRILYNENPSGLGNAFRSGFAAVADDTDAVITLDADLNHQPEEIPRLVTALFLRQADIVIGSRKLSGSTVQDAPAIKTAVSNIVNLAIRKLIGMPVADQTSGFRVYRYEAFRKLSYRSGGFAFLPEILLEAHSLKMKIVEEPIHFTFRTKGESKMNWGGTARSYLTMLARRLRH
jgi:dolichol-phosphate mannosyltransferase